MIYLTLPVFPVPLSSCFVNARGGRQKSRRYKQWCADTDVHLARNFLDFLGTPYKPKIEGRVAVCFYIHRSLLNDGVKRDLDNMAKCLCDTLVRNYVIKDDSLIDDLRIRYAHRSMMPVEVEISPALE